MPPITAHIDTASGGRIYAAKYAAAGDDANPIPVIYIHGFLSPSGTLNPLLPSLSTRTVLTYDFEGMGNSSNLTKPPTLDSLVSLIPLVLTHFGYDPLEPTDIISYSMGGCVAVHLAAQSPAIVNIRKLLLMAPPDLSEPRELWEAAAHQAKTQKVEDLLLFCLSSLGTKARANLPMREEIQRQLHANLAKNQVVMASMWDASADISTFCEDWGGHKQLKLAEESWVLWGKEDGQSDRTSCEAAARVSGAKIVPLNTGHYMSWEDPKGVGEELRRILDS